MGCLGSVRPFVIGIVTVVLLMSVLYHLEAPAKLTGTIRKGSVQQTEEKSARLLDIGESIAADSNSVLASISSSRSSSSRSNRSSSSGNTVNRRLLDGLQVFSDVVLRRRLDSTHKPIEFLEDKHVEAHKATISTATAPLQFLDLTATAANQAAALAAASTAAAARLKRTESHKLHFLKDEDIVAHKAVQLKSSNSSQGAKKRSRAKKVTKDKWVDIHKYEIVEHHPASSPRNGTDISPHKHAELLQCPTQTKCIEPALQLEKKVKVYLCKHPTRHGVRFYYLAREGLSLHPNVDLVTEEDINQADFIIYLPGSAPWHLTECTNASYAPRLIVLDEFDGHTLISPTVTPEQYVERYGGRAKPWYFMYFKRSFVRRIDGVFRRYPHFIQPDVYPMVYGVADAYIPSHFNLDRDIEILCTLRGNKQMATRMRVQTWVAEYGVQRGVAKIVSGQVNTATRTTVSMAYFQQMFNSQIIVTVNPMNWEGDFRLWESMCTGALVFVDPLYVPYNFPLIGGEHVVYFDNNNKTDLWNKLDFYRANLVEARRVAVSGYLYAMKYHRTVSIADYILRSAHLKQTEQHNARQLPPLRTPQYLYTAQYLNYEASQQEPAMLKCRQAGKFLQVRSVNGTASVAERVSCSDSGVDSSADTKKHLHAGNIKFSARKR